jgi:dTDP-4-amino-4,6-dideoxygalactose transaminase
MIPFNVATITAREISLIQESIARHHISGVGPFTKLSEEFLQRELGARRVLLTTSCTHSLEMAALLADIAPGDEVIVPSYTFVSTASAFALHGATPVFVDVDRDTLNLDYELTKAAITPRTKAICVVHYGGISADVDRFAQLAAEHSVVLIEDNAHGLFASFDGKPLGTFGALGTQSFHETKNVTCGEGGALVINDPRLVERAEILREKGTDRSRFLRGQVDKYTWVDIGSSWVLSDMLAAVLWGQLERAGEIDARRVEIFDRYESELREWADERGFRLPFVPPKSRHTGHLFSVRLRSGEQRDRFIVHLKERGVSAVFHYQPLHLSNVGIRFGGRPGMCPVAEEAGDTLVRLPLFFDLSPDDQSRVIDAVRSFDR